MSAPELRVAVSGFDGLDNPHPGWPVAGAIRAAKGERVAIAALGYGPYMTAAWQPGAAESLHVMPPIGAGDAAWRDCLVDIHRVRRLDALIPCLDLEVPVVARLSEALAREGIRTLVPRVESVLATSKLALPRLCHAHGFPTPRTIHVGALSDLPLHADQFGYPLMVKGTVAGAKRATNRDEALLEAKKLNAEWGGGVILQEPIHGEEFVVAMVAGRDGACRGAVAMRKIGVNSMGKGVVGAVVDDPDLMAHARAILAAIDWRGPLELEFVRVPKTKRYYLIEVNCRFPSWIGLSAWGGLNLPALLLDEIMGTPAGTAPARAQPGATFVRDVSETAIAAPAVLGLGRHGYAAPNGCATKRERRRDAAGLRVAVSGISTFDVINSGLGVARALNHADGIAGVVGLGYGAYDSGMYRGTLFDDTYRLPPIGDAEALFRRLDEIRRRAPIDVVVPCLDGEIPSYVSIRERLAGIGIRTLLPSLEAFNAREKPSLFTRINRRDWGGFAIPDTRRVEDEAGLDAAIGELGLPVVLKGHISLALRADTPEEARAAFHQLRAKGEAAALVQPFVFGQRYAVAVVSDAAKRIHAPFSIKKLRICGRGSTWSAVRVSQPALEAAFAEFLGSIGWVGPADGEFIREDETDRFHLIEVNPRSTGWIAFTAYCGVNHPKLVVDLAAGRAPETGAGRADLVFMRACEDVPVSPTAFAAISVKGQLRHG
jgi:carbamoyl-phosphate synthase large subunit